MSDDEDDDLELDDEDDVIVNRFTNTVAAPKPNFRGVEDKISKELLSKHVHAPRSQHPPQQPQVQRRQQPQVQRRQQPQVQQHQQPQVQRHQQPQRQRHQQPQAQRHQQPQGQSNQQPQRQRHQQPQAQRHQQPQGQSNFRTSFNAGTPANNKLPRTPGLPHSQQRTGQNNVHPQRSTGETTNRSFNRTPVTSHTAHARHAANESGLLRNSGRAASSGTNSSRTLPGPTITPAARPRQGSLPVKSSGSRPSTANTVRSKSSSGAQATSRKRQKKKRIPGPAGELDATVQRHGGTSIAADTTDNTTTPLARRNLTSEFGGSQLDSFSASQESSLDGDVSIFESGPWERMCTAMGLSAAAVQDRKGPFPHDIAFVLREGFYSKVAKLAVVIDTIDRTQQDAVTALKDPSGTMKGTIHRKALEEFRSEIAVGTVLVLQNTSVFTARIGLHFLNITPRNIVRIFAPDSHRGRR